MVLLDDTNSTPKHKCRANQYMMKSMSKDASQALILPNKMTSRQTASLMTF